MLKETITYTDYNGEERTEDFYFNLNKAEIVNLQMKTEGGLDERLIKIVKAKDTKKIMEYFQDIIKWSYGVKSDDGKRFIKNQEVLDAFIQSPAYEELYLRLATDSEYAEKFVNGIVPDLADIVNRFENNGQAKVIPMPQA